MKNLNEILAFSPQLVAQKFGDEPSLVEMILHYYMQIEDYSKATKLKDEYLKQLKAYAEE